MTSRPAFAPLDSTSFLPGTTDSSGTRVRDPYYRSGGLRLRKSKIRMTPSDWVSHFVKIKDGNTGREAEITFAERQYLLRPYNTFRRNVLFMTSRQTEKCCGVESLVSLANGELVRAGDVRVGDHVASMRPDGTVVSREVTWVSERRIKPGVRIRTRQGHVLDVATTHPIRMFDRWREAGDLQVGDRIAAVRKCGDFTASFAPLKERIRLTAYLIGDGGLTQPTIRFTKSSGPVLDEFCRDAASLGITWRTWSRGEGKATELCLRSSDQLEEWLQEDGLRGKGSRDKQIPSWVFDLSREDTALFINRLWATDGHVRHRARSQYDLVYASVSERLVRQLQALLWKFRIPSWISRKWPSYWKKRGVEKFIYHLNVETQGGVRTFLTDIGALGKSEGISLPDVPSNSNRDTIPQDGAQDILSRALESRSTTRPTDLGANGLLLTLQYPLSRRKAERYVEVLRADRWVDQSIVDELEQHLQNDLYWDRVDEIEPLVDLECVDFEVEDTHNFVADGIVTHNSTTIGNKLMAMSGMRPNYVSLFVTPSAMQTTVFSRTRLDDIVEISPLLQAMQHKSKTWNILEKEWANGSKIYLRYAFLNADRIRGLSVNAVFCDEIQDLLQDVMPVIEETASHHKDPVFVYSGTPKTFDNTIEHYWSNASSQNEWVIPCERHGTPKDPGSWHWNVLGPKNLGLKGPICDRCGELLNPEHPMAQWVAMRPFTGDPETDPAFEGFRICRLMVPWFFKDPEKWKSILKAHRLYPTAQFMNEVMAISYDSGTKPLSRLEVIRACDDDYRMEEVEVAKLRESHELYGGIDWGGGEGGTSYTVISVGGYTRGDSNFQIVYSKRFDGKLIEPDAEIAEIIRLTNLFRLKYLGTDFGMGFRPNKKLIQIFGPRRIHQFQYQPRIPAKVIYKPKTNRYQVFRTPVMADVFSAIKDMKLRLPAWEVFQKPYGEDLLAIRQEYSDTMKMLKYDKPRGVTDDTTHSIIYALLVSQIDHKRPDIFAPLQEKSETRRNAMYEEDLAIDALEDPDLYPAY